MLFSITSVGTMATKMKGADSSGWPLTVIAVYLCISMSVPSVNCLISYSILEEVPAGTLVGNIVASANLIDEYTLTQLSSFTYRLLDQDSQATQFFTVNQTTGIIQTKEGLDRERICPSELTCEIPLDVVYTALEIFNVINTVVEILDINDNAPEFLQKTLALEIPESALTGATYNLPLARDLDSGNNGVKAYVLQSSVANFELKVHAIAGNRIPTAVQLELRGALDREVTAFYQVVLVATDGGNPRKSGSLIVNITVADANDHGPTFTNSTYTLSVLENEPVGSRFLKLHAVDPDIGDNGKILYRFAQGSSDRASDVFEIIEDTGELLLKSPLDYETQPSFHLLVEARDGGVNSQPAYATVVIQVQDYNDNAPVISVNTQSGSSGTARVSEIIEAGRFVAHISVKDPDTGDAGKFDCSVNDSHFFLQKTQETQYKIVTAAALDREQQETFQIILTCKDHGTPPLIARKSIRVDVQDENDNSPVFPKSSYSVTFPENNIINAFILQVNATDSDKGANAAITYDIGQTGKDMFAIDPKNGIIRANGIFDFEADRSYIFPVIARDGGNPSRSSSSLVSVSLIDTNDEPPRFSKTIYNFDVLENQPVGMEIGIVTASDADSDAYSYFEFSLDNSKSSQNFAIDTVTGHVRTRHVLDREQQSVYHMVVFASNVGISPPLSGSAVITINVLDQNDHAPIVEYPNRNNFTVQVATNVPEGYLVALIQAHDADTGNNARLSYKIVQGNSDDIFTIDPSLGAVATKKQLGGMGNKLYDMIITVSDHGFPTKVSRATLHVMVNDSIAYPHGSNPAKLLSGTNVTIVVSLAVASAIVVIILVIAIIVIRKKELQKRKQKHVYRCQVESKSHPDSVENKDETAKTGDSQGRTQRGPHGSISKANKKEVSFNMPPKNGQEKGLPNGMVPGSEQHGTNQQWSTTPGNNNKCKQEDESKSQPPKKWEYTTIQINGPSLARPGLHQSPSPGGRGRGAGVQGGGGGSPAKLTTGLLALPPQQKPRELCARNLQPQYCVDKGDDQDTDSAYSGDISNTDSGRGPSEEGELLTQGMPFCTTTSGKPSAPPGSVGNNHVDTLQRLHRWQQPHKLYPTPAQAGGGPQPAQGTAPRPASHGPQRANGLGASTARTPDSKVQSCMAPQQQKPRPPPRRSSARDNVTTGHHGYQPQVPRHTGYPDDWRTPSTNTNFNHWDTLAEDDDGSSTSGSYIVDPTDLYLNGSQPAVMV